MARLADGGRPRGPGTRMSEALAPGTAAGVGLEALLHERTEANERFFAAEAERLARLCHLMAERFARGGRLIAIGCSPAARSDARHVAVEFVHPVIVGKRALPAFALTAQGGELRTQVALLARPDDVALRELYERLAVERTGRWPRAIVERTDVRLRAHEGLPQRKGMLRGDPPGAVEFLEGRLAHSVPRCHIERRLGSVRNNCRYLAFAWGGSPGSGATPSRSGAAGGPVTSASRYRATPRPREIVATARARRGALALMFAAQSCCVVTDT